MEVRVIKDFDLQGDVIVPEAAWHDLSKWPHCHTAKEIETMFPTAVAAEEYESASIEEFQEHQILHKRCVATKIAVTRG